VNNHEQSGRENTRSTRRRRRSKASGGLAPLALLPPIAFASAAISRNCRCSAALPMRDAHASCGGQYDEPGCRGALQSAGHRRAVAMIETKAQPAFPDR